MENFTLKEISASDAARVAVAAGSVDPSGLNLPGEGYKDGACFELRLGDKNGVFSVSQKNGVLWIHGAASVNSGGLTGPGVAVVQAIAARAGCSKIGFQTARPGLVKLCKKSGFKVTGYILQKTL